MAPSPGVGRSGHLVAALQAAVLPSLRSGPPGKRPWHAHLRPLEWPPGGGVHRRVSGNSRPHRNGPPRPGAAPVRGTPAYASRQGQTRAPGTSFASSAGSCPVAAPRPATSVPRSGGAVSSDSQPPEHRLPRSEYQRRRASGLCFHCDERWTPAHNCRHLFMLVIDDCEPQPVDNGSGFEPFETEQVDFASLEISLHAITGTGNGNTMRVNLCLNNRPITALIDSGSTHNFVDSATAKELGLLIRACPFLQVAVANGERITGLGVCEDVLLQKDSNYFPVNLFVIPLVGFEIVLGVHWLRTLGAILWDFTALTMTFTYGGRPVTWQGDQVSPGTYGTAAQAPVRSPHYVGYGRGPRGRAALSLPPGAKR
nr:uncharacterized protein LOC109178468 [Ipomoea trifida]